jgi:hypothetical protein
MTKDSSKPGGDLKPFKIGDLQKPGGAAPKKPLRPREAASGSGSGYAFIEGLFDRNDFQPVIRMYDTALEKLKPIALESPDVSRKRDAHRAIKAYDRAMELLTRMLQIRQELDAGPRS